VRSGTASRASRRVIGATALALVAGLTGCTADQWPVHVSEPTLERPSGSAADSAKVPAFDHIVIVVEENKASSQVDDAPYLARLAAHGASFSRFEGETHPSEPNYLALWSGSTQGVRSDECPVDLGRAPSLGSQLIDAHRSVAVYAEDLPAAGDLSCSSGSYARKHNPLADFEATADAEHDLPFSAFPKDFTTLPAVSLVVPNLDHDMHDGSIAAGDQWLSAHLSDYAAWATTHDSLLVVTFDEDDDTPANRIYTTFSGAHVRPGKYSQPVNHVSLLHTVEASFGLPLLGAHASPITDVWR
jgi:hypothetical protein